MSSGQGGSAEPGVVGVAQGQAADAARSADGREADVPPPRERGLRGSLVAAVVAGSSLSVLALERASAGSAVALALGLGLAGAAAVGVMADRLRREQHRRAQAEEAATFLATHDPLTALPSRTLLERRLSAELARAAHEENGLAILRIDLDRFKTVNDALGHQAGDQLLREMANRIESCLRGTDVVSRLGADEFVAIVPGAGQPEAATLVARKILAAIDRPVQINDQQVRTSACIGVARFPHDGTDGPTLVTNADLALERAKERGRRSVELCSAAPISPALDRLNLERDLHLAIANDQLEAHYQPLFDAHGGAAVAMEALLRWRHPQRGLVSPAEFIPIAEDSGLIVPLGEWVLETACRQARLWHDQGHPIRMAVNVSAIQLREPDMGARFAAIIQATGLDPHYLELELTEAVLLKSDDQTRVQLERLRALGVQLAIDDFGTGYSSLSYLTRLKVDGLKIDRSFLAGLTSGSNTEVVVRAVVAIAHSLSLRVVAEGIENEAQRQIVTALGAHELQGFLFARPAPAAEASRFLNARRTLIATAPPDLAALN